MAPEMIMVGGEARKVVTVLCATGYKTDKVEEVLEGLQQRFCWEDPALGSGFVIKAVACDRALRR